MEPVPGSRRAACAGGTGEISVDVKEDSRMRKTSLIVAAAGAADATAMAGPPSSPAAGAAAALLPALGAKAEVARELAYRLYSATRGRIGSSV